MTSNLFTNKYELVIMNVMSSEALRFLCFLCIVFIGVNNLISLVAGTDGLNAVIDIALFLSFFGLGYTVAVREDGDE